MWLSLDGGMRGVLMMLWNVCFLIALVVFATLGMIFAESWKWRMLKAGIILASMGIGLLLAALSSRWGRDEVLFRTVRVSMMLLFGAIGAISCWQAGRDTSIRIIKRPPEYVPPGDEPGQESDADCSVRSE
jgi:MFS family permease